MGLDYRLLLSPNILAVFYPEIILFYDLKSAAIFQPPLSRKAGMFCRLAALSKAVADFLLLVNLDVK